MTGKIFIAEKNGGSSRVIRQAVAEDDAVIQDCAEQAYARYIPSLGRKPEPMTANFKTQISAGQAYVATDADEGVLGFIVFYPSECGILLESVAVLPGAAGQGIGKELISFCEDEARRRGFNVVYLYTNEKMTENLLIYPCLGYAEVARRVVDGFSRVFFEKKLV
jgi:GNAT superfamily N-acetyltransferase